MKTRLVFKVNIARKLVRMGYRIVDLKPAKTKDGKIATLCPGFIPSK